MISFYVTCELTFLTISSQFQTRNPWSLNLKKFLSLFVDIAYLPNIVSTWGASRNTFCDTWTHSSLNIHEKDNRNDKIWCNSANPCDYNSWKRILRLISNEKYLNQKKYFLTRVQSGGHPNFSSESLFIFSLCIFCIIAAPAMLKTEVEHGAMSTLLY